MKPYLLLLLMFYAQYLRNIIQFSLEHMDNFKYIIYLIIYTSSIKIIYAKYIIGFEAHGDVNLDSN